MQTASVDGFLVIDKPRGITSRDAVDRAQRWFPRGTKVGHTGTLDPLATGVLALAIGAGVRLTEYVQQQEKTYVAGLLLGVRSDTDDTDGTVTAVPDARAPAAEEVARELCGFVGEIEQVPPAYSAAKVTGRRAYVLARRGEEVHLEPRRVRIDEIKLLRFAYPHAELEVRCGKGTYIRSLARDLGERLGCGACIEGLRRTRVGPFDVAEAVDLSADTPTARSRLLPLAEGVTGLPRVTLSAADVARLRQGQGVQAQVEIEGEAAAFNETGQLVAIVAPDVSGKLWRPVKVLRT
jgi:tRNA pseudouridine55 synthase